MTPIPTPVVTNTAALHRRDLTTALQVAILFLIAIALWPNNTGHASDANDGRVHRILSAACAFPERDGQATTYAVAGDVIYCWEMK